MKKLKKTCEEKVSTFIKIYTNSTEEVLCRKGRIITIKKFQLNDKFSRVAHPNAPWTGRPRLAATQHYHHRRSSCGYDNDNYVQGEFALSYNIVKKDIITYKTCWSLKLSL